MVLIKRLIVKNFKSIRQMELNCRRVNVFIREPNSGKSNILESLGLLSHLYHAGNLFDYVRTNIILDLFYDRDISKPIEIFIYDKGLRINVSERGFATFYIKTGEIFDERASLNLFQCTTQFPWVASLLILSDSIDSSTH